MGNAFKFTRFQGNASSLHEQYRAIAIDLQTRKSFGIAVKQAIAIRFLGQAIGQERSAELQGTAEQIGETQDSAAVRIREGLPREK